MKYVTLVLDIASIILSLVTIGYIPVTWKNEPELTLYDCEYTRI